MLRLTACAALSFTLLCAPALAKEEHPPQDSALNEQASDQDAEPQTIDYTRPFRFDGVYFPEPDLETIFENNMRQLESANPQFLTPEIVEPENSAPKSE